MSSRRNKKQQAAAAAAKDGPPPSHPQENFAEHRNFLLRSLNRNDVDLAALVKLNHSLRSSKAAIIESCGEGVLLDLGIGRLTLIDDELMMKDELIHNNEEGGRGGIGNKSKDNDDDDDDGRQRQQHQLLTPVQKSMCVDFLLRMKLRRKLCNRLARRLNRVAHAMDGEDVAPPPPPKYGDLRLNVDPTAVEAKVEIWKRKDEAIKEIENAKRQEEAAAAAHSQQKESNETTTSTKRGSKAENVDTETTNQSKEGETPSAAVKSDDAVAEEQATKPQKEVAGEGDSFSPDESKSRNNVADGTGKEEPVQMDVEKTTSSVEEGKSPTEVVSSSSVKIGSNKIDDLKYDYSSSLAKYYNALKEYDTMYEKIWDPTTKKFKFIADSDGEEGAEKAEPEYTQIKAGNGIGGTQRQMSLEEREAEHKRWQAAILSRVPEQPTFEDLGLKNRVFCYEARKKRCLELEQDDEEDDEPSSSQQQRRRQEEGSKRIKLDPKATMDEDPSAMKVEAVEEKSQGGEEKCASDEVAVKILTGEEDEKDDDNKEVKMEEGAEADKMDIDNKCNKTENVKTEDGTETVQMDVDELSTNDAAEGIKKDETIEKKMAPSEDRDTTKEASEQNVADGETTKEKDKEVNVDSQNTESGSSPKPANEGDKKGGGLNKADDESSDMVEADDGSGAGSIEVGESGKHEATAEPSPSSAPLKTEVLDKTAKPEQKNENKKEEDAVDEEEEMKPKKPMSLAPIPSFHEQDMARIRLIHGDLLAASIIEHSRKRYSEATRDYNNAIRVSNDICERQQKLAQNLNFFIAKSRNDITKANSDYAIEVAMAKQRWIKQKHEYDAKRAKSVMPSTWGQLAYGTPLLQSEMRRTQCQGIRGTVSSCLADIVDGSMSILEGRAQLQKKFADFKRPPNSTTDKQTGETLQQRTVAVENQLRRQLNELTAKLNVSEKERERLWKKMMKAKVESEFPQQASGRRNRQIDYNQIPVPPLRKSQQQRINVPARSSVPAYTPPRSTTNPSSQTDGASDSKYSAARVRERIANDGTVAPVSEPKKTSEGLYMRPAGRTRKGMQWDAVRGIWVPEGSQ